MTFHIITIFPKIFDSYLSESLMKRARAKKIIDVRVHNLRDFAEGRHKKARPTRPNGSSGRATRWSFGRVDDRPFGGGPGMVMQLPPIYKAVQAVERKAKRGKSGVRVILFSTRGKKFDAKTAKRLSKYHELILICGRYEGVDERVAQHVADEEISMGDYVLSGGELPALALIEAVSRFIPGFLGKQSSLEESHGSHPVYTRPEVFLPKGKQEKWRVPQILLSGDHKKINAWRAKK